MPAQFLHFVLTRSDTVAIGTNFLAEGHSDEICKAIAEEDALPDRFKFQNLMKMLAILLLKAAERCIVTQALMRVHRCIDLRYREEEAKQVLTTAWHYGLT